MTSWRRATQPPGILTSEKGLLDLAGRESNLRLPEVVRHFRDLVSADMEWVDSRKDRNRRRASVVKIGALVLTALSTVVLGIDGIPAKASIALPLVAAATVLGALEPYFNWRSKWVLMEEAQYRLNRLRDRMDLYLTTTPEVEVTKGHLDEFFDEQQEIWADVSRRWIAFRERDRSPGVDHVTRDTTDLL